MTRLSFTTSIRYIGNPEQEILITSCLLYDARG